MTATDETDSPLLNEESASSSALPSSGTAIPKKLHNLSRLIDAAFQNELTAIARRTGVGDASHVGTESLRTKTIRELIAEEDDPQKTSSRSSSSGIPFWMSSMKLNVIRSWRDLLGALVKHDVFLEYIHSLEEAFREIEETPRPEDNPESAPAQTVWFRHQWNLVKLLTHTAENHLRDNCTHCRFVTLLEVALSYQKSVTSNEGASKVVYQWKPSNDVQRFWVRLMQPIDPEMAPFDFRRKAYGVLVSLSWVPSSKGLLEACSIADSRRGQPLSSNTPAEAQRILHKIPSQPLSRNDSVYQVLDRLKDETNVKVVIGASSYNKVATSGIGKTTVAALVASHPLIVRSFTVLWLTMDYKQMILEVPNVSKKRERKARLDYVTYTRYLDSLCDQLALGYDRAHSSGPRWTRKRPVWPEALSLKRLDEPAIRHQREVHLMQRAQRMMSDYLEAPPTNILLALDDVSEDDELEWFHFIAKQSILATTSTLARIHNADFTVELDPWGEEESIELFLLESQCSASHVMTSAAEVKEIVSRCHYHPIIVRTAARFFMLKKVTSGLIQALEEANAEFSSISEDSDIHPARQVAPSNDDTQTIAASSSEPLINATYKATTVPKALSKLLDQVLSPIVRKTGEPSILFKLCLASMAAVFAECQPVPLTAVFLLWEQLVIMEPDAVDECGRNVTAQDLRRRAWFIAEGLTHIGALSFSEGGEGDAFVEVSSRMYVTYALSMVTDLDRQESTDNTFVQWHKAFVAAYLTRKFEGNNCDSSHLYALQNLPKHMLYCKLYVKVVALLSNGRLYQERVAAFGRERATALHVYDCVQLMQIIRADPKIPREQRDEIATEHFQRVATLLTQNMDLSKESSALNLAKDLYAIGFGLAENGKYAEALNLYAQAHGLVPKSSSFAATILYGLGSLSLILNDNEKAMKSLRGSIASMRILGEDGESDRPRNTLYLAVSRLQGEAMMAQCNYSGAMAQFEETMQECINDDGFESDLEYGILLYIKGRLHQTMGELALATKDLESCIKWKDKLRETSRNLAEAHSVLSDIYAFHMGKPIEARQHVDLALKTLKRVDDEWPRIKYDDEEEFDVEENLLAAKFRTLRADLPDDLKNYELIRQKIVESPVLLMDQSAYDLRFIALAYMASEEHEKAVAALEDALNIMSGRTESLERAQCLLCLGNSFLDQGEAYDDETKAKTLFELALKLFEMALNIQILKVGDSQQLLETLDAIGNLHVHLRQHEIAISVYTDALTLAKKLGSEAEKIAGILYFLGECSEELGNLDQAHVYYKESLVCLRSDRPSDDIDIARPLQRLGAMSLIKAKYADAKQMYDEILMIREANFEPEDVLLAETRDVLGFIEMRLHNNDSACAYLQGALAIRLQHADNLRSIGDTHYQIGLTYRMRGDHVHAISCFEQSLAVLEGAVTKDDPVNANVDLAAGNTYFNMGFLHEAAKRCQQALVVRRSVLGTEHRKTANATRSLGMIKFLIGQDLDDACFLLQEYVRIMEMLQKQQSQTPSADHYRKPDEYVAVLIMLSDIQVANGRHKLARKILGTARQICQPKRDNEHNVTRCLIPPKLAHMVQKRVEGLSASSIIEGTRSTLAVDPNDAKEFQSIILSDD